MYTSKLSIRLRQTVMMIKDSKYLAKKNHFHIKQVLEYMCEEELLEHTKK